MKNSFLIFENLFEFHRKQQTYWREKFAFCKKGTESA